MATSLQNGISLNEKQGALIISCTETRNAVDIIKDIINYRLPVPNTSDSSSEILPSLDPIEIQNNDNVICYPWHIDTKYYSTDVGLYALKYKSLVDEQFADAIQAVVIHFDPDEPDSFKDVTQWMPFIKEFEPEIKILSCERATDEAKMSRLDVHKWCIDHEFELVEFDAVQESEDEDVEDDFTESNGLKRIVQALHANRWPHMKMKDKISYKPSEKFREFLSEEAINHQVARMTFGDPPPATDDSSRESEVTNEISELRASNDTVSEESHNNTRQRLEESIDNMIEEEKRVFDALSSSQPDFDSFDNLFERFKEMKDKAGNLDGDARRLYAEKVAVAFWKALGGPDDEILDPESD